MITADRPPEDVISHKSKTTRLLSQPYLELGICSTTVTPVPPSEKASRHDTLSKRRSSRPLHGSRKLSVKHVKLESLKRDHVPRYKSIGLEIKPEKFVWRGWEPGEEYTKTLTIKNVGVQTKKIKYIAPKTSFFSTLYPQVIALSAGTSFSLPITFKPLEKKAYEDKIEFSTAQGSFTLNLRGILPECNLHIPENIHFGLTAVHEVAKLSFEVRNTSAELATDFAWDGPEPFSFTPRTGTLKPKASKWIHTTFRPSSATVYDATIVCFYGDNMRKTMQAEGIGKYPHLTIENSTNERSEPNDFTEVAFDTVNVNQTARKYITLRNSSNVKAPFKIRRSKGIPWMDEVFTFHVDEHYVPPNDSIKIPITYSPHIPGRSDVDYFEVSSIGNVGKSVFQCTGRSKGSDVILSTSLLHFGLLNFPENVSRRSFYIENRSDADAVYQFDLDQDSGVFRISETSGILSASESKQIIVTFNPSHCINYHRRVTVLVHEQGPLFMDMIGTYHDDELKPHPLKTSHLDRYNIHASRGLSFYPPDILKQQHQEGRLIVDDSGCYKLPNDEGPETQTPSPMAAYFDDGHHTEITSNPPHVSLSQMSIWLGEVQFGANKPATAQTTLQLSNHTHGKVTARWIEDPSGPFQVTPNSCDILPLKTVDFRLTFRPSHANQIYGRKLECYVGYKIMRDFQLIDEKSLAPPWLLTVDVCGHTFNGRCEAFYPKVVVSKEQLVFSPTLPNQSTYRTVVFENKGTTPFLYQFSTEKGVFTIKYSSGFSQSKFTVASLRFTPTNVNSYDRNVTITLNDNSKHNKNIKLIGTGEQPELLLSNGAELFFRPTCSRTAVTREYEVRNVGRSTCYFRWVLSNEDSRSVSVEPSEGTILANQTQAHVWTFKPIEARKYVLKATCLVWHHNGSDEMKDFDAKDARKYRLRIVGEGWKGDVRSEKYNIDFGSVIAGSHKNQVLTLYNDSQCNINVQLSLRQVINSQYGEDADDGELIGLELSSWLVKIPARSKVAVTATARPHRRVVYSWHIFYQLLDESGQLVYPNERRPLCEMSVEGVYPTLSIVDARPSGSGTSISKTQLWRWFSIDTLNSSLDSDPEKSEIRYSINSVQSASRRPSTFTKSIMDFNFGAAGEGSEPCYVSVMVENTGSVPTKWSFMFPKELELEIDYWAETGIFDAEELHHLHIQDNKLFTIHPSKGVLHPGERRTILFSYKHDISGTHRVPVLLKVEKGKEILLNFVGVTVKPDRRYLHFPGTRHVFNPVPIGEMTPPKQLYEMFNGGSMSVIYEVDLAPLRDLEAENYHHPILTCLNPSGEIAPGMSANLEWLFSPLESKTYMIDVPIRIVGGETALITFKGIGYDSRAMGKSMPKLDQPPEFTSVPATQMVTVPGQLLFLSEERISFGNLPLFGKARHVTFLTNQSEDRPLSFSWHATSPVVNEVLSVEPIQGRLRPGQSVMVKIVFCASGQPSFYDLDLVCEVVDELRVVEYHAELEAWNQERERQQMEFVITGNDVVDTPSGETPAFELLSGPAKYELISPKQNIENVLNKSPSPVRLTDSDFSKNSTMPEFKSFQTLPPIRFEDPVKAPSNRSRQVRHQEAISHHEWVRPQYPQPFIAHLGVTARTHDIEQFRLHFTGKNDTNFIDRTMQIDYPVKPKPADTPQYPLTTCIPMEKSLVVSVMSDVIRGLLDDPTFHGTVEELGKEVTPYFGQLAAESTGEDDVIEGEAETGEVDPDGSKTEVDDVVQHTGESSRPSSSVIEGGKSASASRVVRKSEVEISAREIETDKRSPQFGSILEDILSSTIVNVMEEAMKGEVLLTVRPRVVALPPSQTQSVASRKALSDTSPRKSSSNREDFAEDRPSPSSRKTPLSPQSRNNSTT